MKKVLLALLGLILLGQGVKAQPVSDNAVIPMAITVNSILRLNVVDGGNIEFVFNTLNDISFGLSGARYGTTVTVASSGNWDLSVFATTATFLNDAGQTVPLNRVCFNITNGGTFVIGIVAATSNTLYYPNGVIAGALTDRSNLIDGSVAPAQNVLTTGTLAGGNAGNTTQNRFTFNWECGTANCAGGSMAGTRSGRYSTSILLSLNAL
jgi:hypothetical protein